MVERPGEIRKVSRFDPEGGHVQSPHTGRCAPLKLRGLSALLKPARARIDAGGRHGREGERGGVRAEIGAIGLTAILPGTIEPGHVPPSPSPACGTSSTAEQQPSKLRIGVQLPGAARNEVGRGPWFLQPHRKCDPGHRRCLGDRRHIADIEARHKTRTPTPHRKNGKTTMGNGVTGNTPGFGPGDGDPARAGSSPASPAADAPVAQTVEAACLNHVQCGFESCPGLFARPFTARRSATYTASPRRQSRQTRSPSRRCFWAPLRVPCGGTR